MGRQIRPARVLSHCCPKKLGVWGLLSRVGALVFNMIALGVSSPEKAGVGGSIPSLATMFSVTYR